jgi:hypothetical protein
MTPSQQTRLRHLRTIPPAVLTLAELIELGELEALAQFQHEDVTA